MSCPGCDGHLEFTLVNSEEEDRADHQGAAEACNQHAFVACLWAPNSSYSEEKIEETVQKLTVDALLLGRSLLKHAPNPDRLLLVTEDVLKMPEASLLRTVWQLHEVTPVSVHPSRLEKCNDRFILATLWGGGRQRAKSWTGARLA